MISVENACKIIISKIIPMNSEIIHVSNSLGRVLSKDVKSKLNSPPENISAMDGYAICAKNISNIPVKLKVVEKITAGHPKNVRIKGLECTRIFTGGIIPQGADSVIMQEEVKVDDTFIKLDRMVTPNSFIRKKGMDFKTGDILLNKGNIMNVRDMGLAASSNNATLSVYKKPKIAILSTGDEIVQPGAKILPGQIVSSNNISLSGLIDALGAEPIDLGTASDNIENIINKASLGSDFQAIVTTGGISVGEKDLVQQSLLKAGLKIKFWKVAIRPGKPMMFGTLNSKAIFSLPGNPVSSIICALIFLAPAISKFLGRNITDSIEKEAILKNEIPANDSRQYYIRGRVNYDQKGHLNVRSLKLQDSAKISQLAFSNCLILRPPFSKKAKIGDKVKLLLYPNSMIQI